MQLVVAIVLVALFAPSAALRIHHGSSVVRTSAFAPLRMTTPEEQAAAEERYKALQTEKRKEYEEKMLQSAQQVTQNQAAFFNVGKFLLPLVIGVWLYAISTGQIVDLPMQQ